MSKPELSSCSEEVSVSAARLREVWSSNWERLPAEREGRRGAGGSGGRGEEEQGEEQERSEVGVLTPVQACAVPLC